MKDVKIDFAALELEVFDVAGTVAWQAIELDQLAAAFFAKFQAVYLAFFLASRRRIWRDFAVFVDC